VLKRPCPFCNSGFASKWPAEERASITCAVASAASETVQIFFQPRFV
jgi:hypothetical protein